MRQLSKSKLIAFRQCPKRLWLELHKPELKDDSGSEAVFRIGHQVGDIALKIFDPKGTGINVDPNEIGWDESAAQTKQSLESGDGPVFEAQLRIPGALALADVMRPTRDFGSLQWEMIEVKSSTSVHDYHRDDVAIQTYIAHKAGIQLSKVGVAHINNQFVYPGDEDYEGLLHVEDLTDEAKGRHAEVEQWIAGAQSTAALEAEPTAEVGDQCSEPFTCGFCDYCYKDVPKAEDPFGMLPNLNWKRRETWQVAGFEKLEAIPEQELTSLQQRVRESNLSGKTYFDAQLAKTLLHEEVRPIYFLDFETVQFAVPIWKGTRPYQQIPFQYSLHRVDTDGSLTHEAFVDLSGNDPSESLAGALIEHASEDLPVFVYNARFETCILNELAHRFPELQEALQSIVDRVVDLYPIAQRRFYHRSQQGSWGLKSVLPAVCPDLSYEHLEGVADGGMAMEVFNEALAPETAAERKAEIEQQLLDYCHLDTLALVRLREFFAARTQPDPSDFLAVKIDVSEDQIPNRKA